MQDCFSSCVSDLAVKVTESVLKKNDLSISYVFHHKRRVATFEEKVETLKARRETVQHKVDDARRNGRNIETEVENWLNSVDNIINAEVTQVKDLQDKAESKCLIGLCPNFKSRYQLSKKAEEDAKAVDELLQLQQQQDVQVSYQDDPQAIAFPSSKDFEAFDSRKEVPNEILEAVKDASINIIGVYGMAGVGKTTLVKEVARQIKRDNSFDSVVIAAVTPNPDIREIQGRVADMVGLKLEEESIPGRAIRLRDRLKKEKKILVVLDDIWESLDLAEVGIPFGDEHLGCTLLFSSRDRYILLSGRDAQKKIELGVLKEEEAWDLFKKMAGSRVESADLRSTAKEVAKKCAGLPVAISAVAKTLTRYEGSLFAWKKALRQLNKPSPSNFSGVPANAYKAIELSYNYLATEEHKQTFLLCSLLGHHSSLQDLLKYTMGLGLFQDVRQVEDTRDELLTVVSDLKASCLLLDSYNDQYFDMHDLVCDVAISIASKDNRVFALRHKDVLQDWPNGERWEKISLQSASISKVPDQLKCSKLSFLYILNKDPSLRIPTDRVF